MPATIRDLVHTSFQEIGVAPLSGDLPAPLAALGLNTLNGLFDRWNAEHGFQFADLFSTFTLSIGVNPHTIGPSGATWTLTQRPVEILGAVLVDGDLRLPIDHTMTAAEYQAQAIQSTSSTYPRRLYFNPTYPNGSIYFDLVPEAAKSVELWTKRILGSVTLTDTWSFPPGYEDAIRESLKERLVNMPMFSAGASPDIPVEASKARAVIFAKNTHAPSICTADSGLMGSSRDVYDYRSGPFR